MPCMTQRDLTPEVKVARKSAVERLNEMLQLGTVKVTVGRNGAIAFTGWKEGDRSGVSDLCAYRALSNSPALRKALVRAEAMSGNRMDPRAIASGLHSHDGGATWSRH